MADYSQFLRNNPDLLASVQGRMQQPAVGDYSGAPGANGVPQPQSYPATGTSGDPGEQMNDADAAAFYNKQNGDNYWTPEKMAQERRGGSPAGQSVGQVAQTKNAKQSRGQATDAVNERLAGIDAVGQSHLREGEARAAGAAALGAEQGASAERANAFHQDAIAAVKNNRALQDQYRKQAEADLAKAAEEPGGPMRSIRTLSPP